MRGIGLRGREEVRRAVERAHVRPRPGQASSLLGVGVEAWPRAALGSKALGKAVLESSDPGDGLFAGWLSMPP